MDENKGSDDGDRQQSPAQQSDGMMVVGVGASAGGLPAFRALFEALPPRTGMAWVFVQHLERDYTDVLPRLIESATQMKAVPLHDRGCRIEPDHVYIAPARACLRIEGDVLRPEPVENVRARGQVIDHFFQELAQSYGERAFAVLLSGGGSDGVAGLKAVKSEGGVTLVQDEASARYSGMPHSAILAGLADFILPPAQLAEELMRLAASAPDRARLSQPPSHAEAAREQDTLSRILALVWSVSNVDFSYYKPTTLRRRIMRRLMLHKLDTLEDYLQFLNDHGNETQALYQDLVINVTNFFRDPEVFDAIKADVLPALLENRPTGLPIRLWVPGCSSGEEVYSHAINLLEYLGENVSSTPIQLFGTDISEPVIDKARAGLYPASIEDDLSPARLRRFFVKRGGYYQIAKPVRDLCIFARQNVFRDPPFSSLDLISCRNVLIYFGPELQKRVLPLFHYALRPGGFLVLGNSESIGNYADYFALAHPKHKIYSRKSGPAGPLLHFSRPYPSEDRQVYLKNVREEPLRVFDPQREAERLLLENYGPPSVLINSDLNILQFRGRTGLYLEPAAGAASFNLLRMAREGLMLALHTAVHEAMSTNRLVRQQGVRFRNNGDHLRVDIQVVPLSDAGTQGEKFMLVIFENTRPDAPEEESSPASAPPLVDDESLGLRQELAATKEYLQSVIESQEAFNEELRSANEEILSANEELQSTNEELETAKEELQSANEELTTLNEELQNRNDELARANDDLSNLLNSVNIAIVMLDSDLRVRRFTPLAEKLMNLIPADIGRPFGNINPGFDAPDLLDMVREVTDTLSTRELEVQDKAGHWYMLRVRPYRTVNNKIEGALLALMDIDEMKQSIEEAAHSVRYAETLIEIVREPMLILDDELRVRRANQAFYEVFQLPPHEVLSRPVYGLAGGRWENADLRRLLDQTLAVRNEANAFVVEHQFPHIGFRRFEVNARRVLGDGTEPPAIVLAFAEQRAASLH